MIASSTGHLDLVRVLLNEGCNINAQDKTGTSVFGHALTSLNRDNIGLINLLIEAGAVTNTGKFEWKSSHNFDNIDHETNPVKKLYLKQEKSKKNLFNSKVEEKSYFAIHQKKKTYSKISKSLKIDSKSQIFSTKFLNPLYNDSISVSIKRGFEKIAIKLIKKDIKLDTQGMQTAQYYIQLAIIFKAWNIVKFLLLNGVTPKLQEIENKEKWGIVLDDQTKEILQEMIENHFVKKNFKKKKKNIFENESSNNFEESKLYSLIKTNNFSESVATNSSKGANYLLSQLSIDPPDSCGKKLLKEISVKSSSETTTSKIKQSSYDEYTQTLPLLQSNISFLIKNDLKIEKKKTLRNNLEKEIKELENKIFENKNLKNKIRKKKKSLNNNEDKPDYKPFLPTDDIFILKEQNLNNTIKSEKRHTPMAVLNNSNNSFQLDPTKQNNDNEYLSCIYCTKFVENLSTFSKPNKIEQQIGEDIICFEKEVDLIHQSTKQQYYSVKLILENIIRNVYNKPFTLEIFGSFVNGFNLPGADLDLLLILKENDKNSIHNKKNEIKIGHKYSDSIISNSNSDLFDKQLNSNGFPEFSQLKYQQKFLNEKLLDEIHDKVSEQKQIFKESTFLRNAQFPVLKIKTETCFGCFPVDITIQDNNNRGLKCVDLILKFHKKYPPLKPLSLIIKQLLNYADLSDPYLGGLSSYGVILMIIAYFQFIEWNFNTSKRSNTQPNTSSTKQMNFKYDFIMNSKKVNLQSRITNSKPFKNNSKKLNDEDNKTPKINPYSIDPVNLGKLLLGVLYFYGFQFDPYRQFIKVSMPEMEVSCPFIEVKLTRNII